MYNRTNPTHKAIPVGDLRKPLIASGYSVTYSFLTNSHITS